MQYWVLHIKIDRTVLLIIQIAEDGVKTYIKFDTRLPRDNFVTISDGEAKALLESEDGKSGIEDPPNHSFDSLEELSRWLNAPGLEEAIVRYSDSVSTARIRIPKGDEL